MSDYEHPLLRDKWKDRELWESLPKDLALIKSTDLYYEPGRGLILQIHFKYGAGEQSWVMCMTDTSEGDKMALGAAGGLELVHLVCAMFGEGRLKDLEGRYAYAIKDVSGFSGLVRGIAQVDPDGQKFLVFADWWDWQKSLPKLPAPSPVTKDRK